MSRTTHARKPKESATAWRSTSAGMAAYARARTEAQDRANETGFDHGLEPNDVVKQWRVFVLPMKHHRCGFERTCEVVTCDYLDTCRPGHGP